LAAGLVLVTLPAASRAGAAGAVIAMLGDSLTAGYGLPDGQGLVPQLQGWMDRQGIEAHLVNAGVSGDTTAGGLARLDWTLTPDVTALVVELGANDMLRGLPPSEARANLDQILARAADRKLKVLLIGFHAPGNWGPDYKTQFDAIFPDLAAKYHVPLYPDYFAALKSVDDGSAATRAELMQGDGLHPSAKGVGLIVPALGPEVAKLADE